MPNRYHSDFNGKLSAPVPPKDSGKHVEVTKQYLENAGPRRNTVDFPEVKAHVYQRMPDDSSTIGGVFGGATQGASMGSMAGPWGTAIGAVIGGLLGGFTKFGQKKEEEDDDISEMKEPY